MYLKILPFNKTLFKKDFNQVKILIFIMTIILFFNVTLFVVSRYGSYIKVKNSFIEQNVKYDEKDLIKDCKEDIAWRLEDLGVQSALMIAVPIGLAAILFGEEKRKKTFEVLAVMPYTRYEIFFNKLIVALVSIALPFIINGIVMLLALGFISNLRMFYSMGQVIKWILHSIYCQLPILSFSILFGIITGNLISQLVLTGIFLIFPMGFSSLIAANLELWGIAQYLDLNTIYFTSFKFSPLGVFETIGQGVGYYFIYIAASIIMIIISKMLFDKSMWERNGELLQFENTEGFFKFGVTICTALLMVVVSTVFLQNYIYDFYITRFLVLILGYILGGILGYIGAHFSIKLNKSKA
ncbi:hypothetical protein EDD65_10341 [Keratinibaculum paraultunense]|uniref:ABC-2 family transporter n=1 Tax=Keratinibaculum paraultunense TaxID=1278232 RepID=A0A4R3KZA4_9FIRM|nr:ABC transporter permease subunit [Keratinibaculum paraultunense]QQY80225.1 hypothetical protein JL105_02495 [Keratinibaculum paraultunense]TCS90737.1 hypothetical protein EDD65_10341 [Keratinibaculum paraultunense]